MKNTKKYTLLTALICGILLGANQATYGINEVKDPTRPERFYLSYSSPVVADELKKDPLVGDGPAIGKYGQQITPTEQQYNFLQPIVFIELKPKDAVLAPDALVNALLKQKGKPPFKNKQEAIAQLASQMKIDVYAIVWGSPLFEKPADKTYNLVFHPLARKWAKAAGATNLNNLSVKLPVGIFDPKGIEVVSVAANNLRAEDVVIHPAGNDLAYSPNNMQFKIKPNTQLAGFWSVAVSQDTNNAAIIYNIIADDTDVEETIRNSVLVQYSLEGLETDLGNLSLNQSSKSVINDLLDLLAVSRFNE